MRSALRWNLSLLIWSRRWKGSVSSFVMCVTIRKNKVVPPDCFAGVKVTYMKIWKELSWIPHSLPMKLGNTTLSCRCKRLTSGSSRRKYRGFRTLYQWSLAGTIRILKTLWRDDKKPPGQNTLHVGVAVSYGAIRLIRRPDQPCINALTVKGKSSRTSWIPLNRDSIAPFPAVQQTN